MSYNTDNLLEEMNKIHKYSYIALFFLLYLSSGYGVGAISGTKRLLCCLLLFFFICITNLKIRMDRFIVPIGCLIVGSVSTLINGEEIKQLLILLSYFILAISFCSSNSFDETCHAYVKVMNVICIASLVIYAIDMFAPDVLNILPQVINSAGGKHGSILLAVTPYMNRNYGMFWEPGAFQTYILLAFIIENFYFKAENRKRIAVLTISLITTFSTAGYASVMIAVVAVLLSGMLDSRMKKPTKNTIIFLIVGAIAACLIITNFYPQLAYTLFGKLEAYGQTKDADSSTGVRVNAIIDVFKVFCQNPIFGYGKIATQNLFFEKYAHSMTTCTYANWFAFYGIFYGIAMVVGLYKFTGYFFDKKLVRLILFVSLMASITGEDYANNSSILIWIFYGWDLKRYKQDTVENNYEGITNKQL